MHIPHIVQGKITKIEKKSIKKNDSDANFEIDVSETVKHTALVSNTARPHVHTAWMLHEVDNFAEDKKKMKVLGDKLLQYLNSVRLGFLTGEITLDNIKNLQDAVSNSQIELQFPELQDTLNDIRIRASIELAKLEKGRE
jgi:hypothetical protein